MANNTQNNVLIVGGSSGIGLGVAKLALRHLPGARIVISSSNEGKCEKAVEEIKNEAPQDSTIQYVVGDVGRFDSQHEDVEAVLKAATEKFGSAIDHIVWTAGSPPSSLQTDQKGNQDILAMATSRIYGPLALTTLAKKYMNDSRHSSITITSGVLIYRPVPGRARAIGAGGAIESTAHALAVELAPIRSNFVVLGAIHTPLLDGYLEGNEEYVKALEGKTLLKCIGSAEEAAEAYVAAMRCSYMTGSRLDVDGGALLG